MSRCFVVVQQLFTVSLYVFLCIPGCKPISQQGTIKENDKDMIVSHNFSSCLLAASNILLKEHEEKWTVAPVLQKVQFFHSLVSIISFNRWTLCLALGNNPALKQFDIQYFCHVTRSRPAFTTASRTCKICFLKKPKKSSFMWLLSSERSLVLSKRFAWLNI